MTEPRIISVNFNVEYYPGLTVTRIDSYDNVEMTISTVLRKKGSNGKYREILLQHRKRLYKEQVNSYKGSIEDLISMMRVNLTKKLHDDVYFAILTFQPDSHQSPDYQENEVQRVKKLI